MPVYRLEPVRGSENHHYWQDSIVPPIAVWVEAKSPGHARLRMQGASAPGGKPDARPNPWVDSALVRCIEDASRRVPPNTAIMANGQVTLKLEDSVGQV